MNYSKPIVFCGATLIAAIALAAAALPVHAGTPRALVIIADAEDSVTRHVSYADLNLAAAAGERTLNQRVGNAVTDVCNEAVGGASTSFQYRNCLGGAWGRARPQVELAVQRGREIAANGSSAIGAVAITIAAPQ
jgi:UrcA family protein